MSQYRYFKLEEFACNCGCGRNEIKPEFVQRLDILREMAGFPFVVTSGYRCPDHPVEAKKEKPGRHSEGDAADIAISGGAQRYMIQKCAYGMNFGGIGPAKTYVHIDDRKNKAAWVY